MSRWGTEPTGARAGFKPAKDALNWLVLTKEEFGRPEAGSAPRKARGATTFRRATQIENVRIHHGGDADGGTS